MNTTKPAIPKGMRDLSPSFMFRKNYIISAVKTAFKKYGFLPIETPAIESMDTLTGKYGDEGERLIFKILNSGDFLSNIDFNENINSRSITKKISSKGLRYDLTVPLARYVSQNRNDITFPFKRYQMQNVWRADRPQKGRYREFFQCDADIVGTKSLLSEVELVLLYDEVFTNLKIPNIEICINNRKVLIGMVELMDQQNLFNEILVSLDKLDKIGIKKVKSDLTSKGVSSESLLVLDKFLSAKTITDLSKLLESSKMGREGVEELRFIFDNVNKLELKTSKIRFDISLARGIDYYTGSIFEVVQQDTNIGSLSGGGRYDNLTAVFGLEDVSGVGISFGIDRMYLVMDELICFPKDIDQSIRVMIINFGEETSIYSLKVLRQLRENSISSELYPAFEKIKKQMNYANKRGVEFVIMIGEDEIESGKISVKDMNSGSQDQMTVPTFIKKII